ncbi:MAG: hypothetical protein N3D82_03520 [Ignisphaera sp.]|nr:hypothetical protein [Ignisphaera sp.]MCX8168077.1 hypothetical protein [Ignisphaera sp.]MDW8085901.1 hypothetical protein [Ignisphaera sp.]
MKSAVKRSEDSSSKISQELVDHIKKSGNILIAHCGATYGLVQHTTSILKISKPELALMAADGDYTHNVMLPYIAETLDLAIIYSDAVHERAVARLLHSVLINNIRTIFILPNVIYERYRAQWSREFGNIDIIEIDSDIYRLTLLLASLKVGINIGSAVARINRMKDELEISSVVEDVVDRYRDAIEMLKSCRNIIVSKTMLPLGEYLEEHGYNMYVMNAPSRTLLNRIATPSETFVLAYSSIEDHIVNEFTMEALRKGFLKERFVDFRINTDPFTAPIYGILISMAAILGGQRL